MIQTLEPRRVKANERSHVDPVQDSGNGGEERRTENLSIFEQAKSITGPVTDSPSKGQSEEFAETLNAETKSISRSRSALHVIGSPRKCEPKEGSS